MTTISAREVGATGVKVTILGLGGAPLGDFSELIPEDRADATVEAAWAAVGGAIGAITLATLDNGLVLLRASEFARQYIRGLAIMPVGVVDGVIRRRVQELLESIQWIRSKRRPCKRSAPNSPPSP